MQDNELRSSVLGNAWFDVAHQKIRFRERRLLELERVTPYLEKLTTYPHEYPPNDIPQGSDWLENLILASQLGSSVKMEAMSNSSSPAFLASLCCGCCCCSESDILKNSPYLASHRHI